ncbi:hypothetical protein [Aromatoleum bremense]|uniref:Uncharacterized protein n=1 Tax=Aromatoleum bremense TaxID=76115 RepID=A0ABX1NRR1_9RHOO|nr:hypothetical protein [Aromatoleum bremense]NMG14392.1 hypothetical protein [Aromatoleum bremense]QTQ31014.1 Uncharacterized protein pbN1_10220 [Aromatoleum bremense]
MSNGSAHANGNFTNKSGASSLSVGSTISAHGDADLGIGGGQSNVDRIDVPSASDYINENKDKAGVIHGCTIPSGDLDGNVYFCEGDASTSGDFSNGTIMAIGDVAQNGSAHLGGDSGTTLTVAIIAGGNITVNGSNDTYGVFWADGTVTQNGSSILGGSIVARGDITRNGAFNYVQYDDFGELPLPVGGTAIQRWVEIIN